MTKLGSGEQTRGGGGQGGRRGEVGVGREAEARLKGPWWAGSICVNTRAVTGERLAWERTGVEALIPTTAWDSVTISKEEFQL